MLCPYYACVWTLVWRTMLQEEVFLFVARKSPFPFSEHKNGSFCEVTTNRFRMLPSHFPKILDHLTWTISQPGHLKPFRPSRVKRTNVCRIGRKWVRFVLHVHDLSPVIF